MTETTAVEDHYDPSLGVPTLMTLENHTIDRDSEALTHLAESVIQTFALIRILTLCIRGWTIQPDLISGLRVQDSVMVNAKRALLEFELSASLAFRL